MKKQMFQRKSIDKFRSEIYIIFVNLNKMENKTEKLKFADIKNIVAEHLKTAVNSEIEGLEISAAVQKENIWRVLVEFEKKTKTGREYSFAMFAIDATNGEVKGFTSA